MTATNQLLSALPDVDKYPHTPTRHEFETAREQPIYLREQAKINLKNGRLAHRPLDYELHADTHNGPRSHFLARSNIPESRHYPEYYLPEVWAADILDKQAQLTPMSL